MSQCKICGAKLGGSSIGYDMHVKRYHGSVVMKSNLPANSRIIQPTTQGDGSTGAQGTGKIVPQRLTDRSKYRIIEEMEWVLGKAIFPDTRPFKF